MKSKFKDYLLYSLACVGVVSLFLSAIDSPKEDSTASVGNYHAVTTDKYVVIYNTQTGRSNTFETNERTTVKNFR